MTTLTSTERQAAYELALKSDEAYALYYWNVALSTLAQAQQALLHGMRKADCQTELVGRASLGDVGRISSTELHEYLASSPLWVKGASSIGREMFISSDNHWVVRDGRQISRNF